jgi:N-acetylmuramoyl-L-alanine amidase
MITNPSKTSHRYLRKLLVLPVASVLVILFAFKYRHSNDQDAVRADESFTIVVDAGHGGIDPGVKSPDNRYTEAQLNLEIAKKIEALAGEYNVNVIMTREDDRLPGDATKISDGLINRVNLANGINPIAFVSVHLNNSSSQNKDESTGVEAYVSRSKQDANNERLASAIIGEISGIYKTKKEIQKRDNHGVFVLDKTSCPSVLLECGYISNPGDLAFISAPANQEKMARAILSGIVKYADDKLSVREDYLRDTVPQHPEIVFWQVSRPAKKSPTAEQLKSWMDAKTYGVWIDEKRIDNGSLAKYKPSEFRFYSVSRLEKNATNYGKHYYQVDLMTHKYYEKSFPNEKQIIVGKLYVDSSHHVIPDTYEKSLYGNKLLRIEKTPVDSTYPLIVIDGKLMPGLTAAKLDGVIKANDIESINVYKNWEAAAKYGEAGRHGVISIVTKESKIKYVELWIQDTVNSRENNIIFDKVEIEPTFPGGARAWMTYFEKNLNPDVPVDNNAPEGNYTVYVQFVVRKNGTVTDARALTNHGFGMEQEAIRAITKGPNWEPAIQNGHKVNAYRKMVITFVVASDAKPPVTKGSSLNELVVIGYKKPIP